MTSIAYTTGDPVAMAKALTKYAKDVPEFTFKVGVVEGRVISIKEIEALASMPSKEELYSKLLFLINAPAQRLVTVMNAVGRDLAVVINQGVEKGSSRKHRNWAILRLCDFAIENLADVFQIAQIARFDSNRQRVEILVVRKSGVARF